MAAFQEGRTQVLVATTVIEVGVDVPNASIMVIEQADLFGLSQLHQLRGRVGRGAAASTCLLLYRSPLGETAKRRLMVLRETEDGFRIAEEDLAIRGAGDLIGTAQSGLPRFRIADLETQTPLMALAQSGARALLGRDPGLETTQGRAARTLLWLMEQDKAIRLDPGGLMGPCSTLFANVLKKFSTRLREYENKALTLTGDAPCFIVSPISSTLPVRRWLPTPLGLRPSR
jgi:ATP-dependent DNA helicase RecG